jgi:sphingomyelin phosphodiesterase acid-like 3
MSGRHTACSGKPDTAAAETQLNWLRDQLDAARNSHQHIWVMAHIPSGIDPYTTAARMRDVCGGSSPEMFLTSEDLPRLLAQYTDVIQLALFAHTHMDEMRLLKSDSADASSAEPGVPVKFVPSISPINGNAPAFVVAAIAPSNAVLADYRVIAAPEKNAVGYKWKEQYDYDATYHQKAFDAAALNSLFTGFAADAPGTSDASSAYLRNYYVRDRSAELRLFWPQYVCALSAYSTNDYKSCRCANPKP